MNVTETLSFKAIKNPQLKLLGLSCAKKSSERLNRDRKDCEHPRFCFLSREEQLSDSLRSAVLEAR